MSPSPAPSAAATTAAEQLRRLLLILPALADDQAHPLSEIAARVGSNEATVRRDLRALVLRDAPEPAGFTEGVSLMLGADAVQFQTTAGHFRRPMALTLTELRALELGLAMIALEVPPDERDAIARARQRLERLLTESLDRDEADLRLASLGAERESARGFRHTLQECIRDRHIAEIGYRNAMSDADTARRVRPLGVVWARGHWYLVAWCERSDGLRVFRFDRISAVLRTGDGFAPAEGFSLESVLRDGRVLVGGEGAPARIRFSPNIARWIAEREQGTQHPDGSFTVEVTSFQEEWAIRHVLRYGPDAVIESPPALRESVASRLRAMLGDDPQD